MTESELIDRCRRGDREAQRLLYEETCERVYRLLLRMMRCPETAADLAQDVYMQAFTRISQFKGDSSVATWLYRIAVNAALQYQRRRRPLPLSSDAVQEKPRIDFESDRTIASIDLDNALNRLDPSDQAILLLRYQEGLDYRAIGDALECPSGTVASRLNRARDRLRQILGNGYSAPEETADALHPTIRTGSVQSVDERASISSRPESE